MAGVLKYTLAVRHPETGEAVALLAGEPVPAWASDLVHEDDIEGAGGDSLGYADLKAAELKAEIEKRNESRDDDAKLPVSGSKADLVAVLEADDAASA